MKRRLFTILSALSLLLALTLAMLWMRSYYIPDTFVRTSVYDLPDGSLRRRDTTVAFAGAECRFKLTDTDFSPGYLKLAPRAKPTPQRLRWRDDLYYDPGGDFFHGGAPQWRCLGFAYLRAPGGGASISGVQPPATIRMTWTFVRIPLWAPLLVAAALPAIWIIRRFFYRPPRGLCPSCGYDLRATPDRCPECGTVPASARA